LAELNRPIAQAKLTFLFFGPAVPEGVWILIEYPLPAIGPPSGQASNFHGSLFYDLEKIDSSKKYIRKISSVKPKNNSIDFLW